MILKGDCIEVMKAIKPNSVDAIVCDPPYGLEFMGKEWDKLWDKREFGKTEYSKKSYTCSDGSTRKTNPVTRNLKNPNYKAGIEAQLWHTQWLTKAYRVLKPGGSMLVMGGTRTSHRLACAIEDSGFIIKDTLMWLYGSGFPKAQDLGKMIDKRNGRNQEIYKPFAKYLKEKRIEKKLSMSEMDKKLGTNTAYSWWEGRLSGIQLPTMKYYLRLKEILSLNNRFDKLIEREEAERKILGRDKNWSEKKGNVPFMSYEEWNLTAHSTDLAKHWDGFKVGGIKPAYEPIIWSVKPPEGSYVDNVLKWGVGAVNVDECRVGTNDGLMGSQYSGRERQDGSCYGKHKNLEPEQYNHSKGHFPANVILDEEAGRLLDEQSGDLKSGGGKKGVRGGIFGNQQDNPDRLNSLYQDNGGASRFFYCAKASRGERNAGLDDLMIEGQRQKGEDEKLHGQSGGAQQALKEGKSEYIQKDHIGLNKIKIVKNNHPTVKPIKLFEYLIKLVTREGQIILDPFIGSGTTAIAAHNTGRKCVGIEKEDEYLTIAKRRIDYWKNQPKQMILGDKNVSI